MSWRVAGILFALGVLTRIPFQTDYVWAHDSVLYARAIERFDPLDQRPQAPGYLYYVLLIRAMYTLVGDPNRAMTIVSLVAGAAAVALLYLFAARLYDERTARASGAFMLTAVTFWTYGGVAYPYTLLAALSIGCAMLFWRVLRAESGRGWHMLLATAAYGIAIGFRTDLAVFLAPLWLMAAWTTPLLWAIGSAALGALLVLVWFFASAAADGGVSTLLEAMRVQGKFVDERYSLFGDLGLRALYGNTYELGRFLGRGLTFLAPLLAAVPLSASARRIEVSDRRRIAFVLLWTLTPLAIYVPIHVGEYGYIFSMLPGLCVIAARGAVALARGARMPRSLPWIVADAALAMPGCSSSAIRRSPRATSCVTTAASASASSGSISRTWPGRPCSPRTTRSSSSTTSPMTSASPPITCSSATTHRFPGARWSSARVSATRAATCAATASRFSPCGMTSSE